MKIIISPAKAMKEETAISSLSKPIFLSEAKEIYSFLKEQDKSTLSHIWDCNEKLVNENAIRLEKYNLTTDTIPAILLYNGLQFKKMNPESFDSKMWDYVNSHLVILSGLYGYLRASDGINPYRLMMMADIHLPQGNLYKFWGDKIYNQLVKDDKVILNLASKEYSDVITPYLTNDITFVNVSFLSKNKRGELINKSTEAKTNRGAMVKFLASKNIENIADVKLYNDYGYHFDNSLSSENNYVFIKG